MRDFDRFIPQVAVPCVFFFHRVSVFLTHDVGFAGPDDGFDKSLRCWLE